VFAGMDRRDGKGLAELMAELGKIEGLEWMRILYAYPSYFSEELIDEIANNPKVRPLRCILRLHVNPMLSDPVEPLVLYMTRCRSAELRRHLLSACSPSHNPPVHVWCFQACCQRATRKSEALQIGANCMPFPSGVQVHRHTTAAYVEHGPARDEPPSSSAHPGSIEEAKSAYTRSGAADYLHIWIPRCPIRPPAVSYSSVNLL